MKRTTLISLVAAGLALMPVRGVLAAASPDAPNPYPNRESKVVADFETDILVTSDPNGTGENVASVITETEFVAQGDKALKLDLADVAAGSGDFTIEFAEPIDITGYQVLTMDVFIPAESIESSWYQFQPRVTTTTSLTDDATTELTSYGPGNMQAGWNHLVWTLRNGTDTKLTQLAFDSVSGGGYYGPVYVDNIRVYKGSFVGLQPDEQLVAGFDAATDVDFFTTLGGVVTVDTNTDKQFVSQGDASLKIDLTGHAGGWTQDVARADDLGATIDASNATAIHLDIFVPDDSYTAESYHEIGFVVLGEGGEVRGHASNLIDGQWVTLEIPLTPDQAQMLTNITGLYFITNSGDEWTGPIYVDALRVVVPTPPPTAGG